MGLLSLAGSQSAAQPGADGAFTVSMRAPGGPIFATAMPTTPDVGATASRGAASKGQAILGGAASKLDMIMSQQASTQTAALNFAVPATPFQVASPIPTAPVATGAALPAVIDPAVKPAGYVVPSVPPIGNAGGTAPGTGLESGPSVSPLPGMSGPGMSGPGMSGMRAPDVFGSVAMLVRHTALDAKWHSVDHYTLGRGPWTGLIRANSLKDPMDQAVSVNRWVNAHMVFASDAATQGKGDDWANAGRSLRSGRGDCEDYAIAKLQILRAMGFKEDDLYLVIARDLVRRADHAILAVRINGDFLILDSATDALLDGKAAQDYRPIFSYSGNHAWVHGYRMQSPAPTFAPDIATRPMQVASR